LADWLDPTIACGVAAMRGPDPAPNFGLMQKYAKQIAG